MEYPARRSWVKSEKRKSGFRTSFGLLTDITLSKYPRVDGNCAQRSLQIRSIEYSGAGYFSRTARIKSNDRITSPMESNRTNRIFLLSCFILLNRIIRESIGNNKKIHQTNLIRMTNLDIFDNSNPASVAWFVVWWRGDCANRLPSIVRKPERAARRPMFDKHCAGWDHWPAPAVPGSFGGGV